LNCATYEHPLAGDPISQHDSYHSQNHHDPNAGQLREADVDCVVRVLHLLHAQGAQLAPDAQKSRHKQTHLAQQDEVRAARDLIYELDDLSEAF
jgi:hypothetical protein